MTNKKTSFPLPGKNAIGKRLFPLLSLIYTLALVGLLALTHNQTNLNPWLTPTIVISLVILYLLQSHLMLLMPKNAKGFRNISLLASSLILATLFLLTPSHAIKLVCLLDLATTMLLAILFGRAAAYTLLGSSFGLYALVTAVIMHSESWKDNLPLLVWAILTIEILIVLSAAYEKQTQQLLGINRYAYDIAHSLELPVIADSIDKAIRSVIPADTYFFGLLDNGAIRLELFFDDGEYFENVTAPTQGTLAGWIIAHKQPLFLPDLRQEVELEGVKNYIIGKERSNLSWMGVPLGNDKIYGVLAAGSYQANAFTETDFQILQSLGLHTTQTLVNAIQHQRIRRQAQLDSLTQAYNHGTFIQMANQIIQSAQTTGTSIGLIMLDIDFFKHYNDAYGHLTGDQALRQTVQIIQAAIKQSDLVGRWGGEEFAVLLNQVTKEQALAVAKRIQSTIKNAHLENTNIQAPTVSQGIAIFPEDGQDIMSLIETADQRLYEAKARGRDQIQAPV